MMKNIAIKKLFLFALILLVVSCSDLLEINPKQSIAEGEALETIEDFEAAVTGVYDLISSSNYYGRYFILTPDVMADDVKQNSQANRAKEYAEYVAFAEHFVTEGLWEQMYQSLNAANAIINSDAEVAPVEQDALDHIVGEAYAIRGQIFFDLVRLYGQHYTFTDDASHLGIPLILEHDRLNDPNRNTVKEVYDQIISDMTDAISLMNPATRTGSTSTLSSTAVKALLSRVYLYKEDWENAEKMATEVIESGEYTLLTHDNYYTSGWVNDYSSESIFEIAMTENDNRGSDALGRMYIEEGYGDYLPSGDLSSLIPEGDARRAWFESDDGLSGDYAPYRLVKYPSVTGQNNTKVIRLSEIYLIRAEAAAMQEKEIIAQSDVTLIRQRGLPSSEDITATGDELLQEVLLERRKELAYEGQRLWDLMRQKENLVRNECTAATCEVEYGDNRFVLPISAAELNANPNISQNPGY